MRRLFKRRFDIEYQEAPSQASIAWRKLKNVGLVTVCTCLICFIGLLFGAFTGTVIVPGKEPHFIALADSPFWFFLAMTFNAVVSLVSAGYVWVRVLGR